MLNNAVEFDCPFWGHWAVYSYLQNKELTTLKTTAINNYKANETLTSAALWADKGLVRTLLVT